jgi:hypothetical protein
MDQWSQNFALARLVGLNPDEFTGKWIGIGSNFHGYDDKKRLVIIHDFYNSLDELRWVDDAYGNSEIAPSDVFSPIEMTVMFLSCRPHMRTEAILKSLDLWVEK